MIEKQVKLISVGKAIGDQYLPPSEQVSEKQLKRQNQESALQFKNILFTHSKSPLQTTTISNSQNYFESIQLTISKAKQQTKDNFEHQNNTTIQQSPPSDNQNEYNFKMNTNIFTRIFMFDYLKILIHLYKTIKKSKTFSYNSLPYLEKQEQISYQYDIFSLIYYQRLDQKMYKNQPFTAVDLLYVIIKCHLSYFIKIILLLIFFFAIKILSSLCIRELLNAISQDKDKNEIFIWVILICLSLPVISMLDQHFGRVLLIQYQQLRMLLLKHIHTKVSTISSYTISQNNLGKLMNLISNDLSTIEPKIVDVVKLPILALPTIAAGIISYYRQKREEKNQLQKQ